MKIAQYDKTESPALERANLIISQFVTSCSHSMRGPLTSIKGLVNLLYQSDKFSKTDALTLLDHIQETAVKMENTLDELEQILENTKREIMVKKINWVEMTDSVLVRFQKEITAANIKVETAIHQSTDFFTDSQRVYLILSHLIENAIRFQDENKSTHSIHIGVQSSKKKCTIRVSDNGIGIPREVQRQIFNLFFRATRKTQGAGVGLYIVREAVEKMGGSIDVESIPEMGSVFTITTLNLAA